MVDDGRWDWTPYRDIWDVCTNGRSVSEEEAMEEARYFSREAKK